MKAKEWLEEKETLKKLCGDLIISALWHPEIKEAHGNTDYHDVRVTRKNGVVRAEVRRI